MPATYRAMMITRPGGPEVLQPVDLPVAEPGPGELRVRVRACGVGATDLIMLTGGYAFAPKLPLVGGYEIAGVVEALGAGVSGFHVGQRDRRADRAWRLCRNSGARCGAFRPDPR